MSQIKKDEQTGYRAVSGYRRLKYFFSNTFYSEGAVFMNLKEQTVKKIYKFKGRIINVRQDEALTCDGRPCSREVIEHPGGVSIIAFNDKNELFLVKQYRYPIEQFTLELPAGKLERGEDPLECAKRELTEETGYEAEKFELFDIMYPSPGCLEEKHYIFTAENLKFKGQHLDEDEFLDVKTLPLEQAVEMAFKNEITDAKTKIGILKLALLKKLD